MTRHSNMGPEPDVVTSKMYEALSDGEWHDREAVVQAVIGCVPPGQAMRKRELTTFNQRQIRERKGLTPAPRERRAPTAEAQVRAGARSVISNIINRKCAVGIMERKEHEGRKMLRLINQPTNTATQEG